MELLELKGLESLDELLKLLKQKQSTEIEIGSGNGHFVVEYGLKHKKKHIVCIEYKKKRCQKILKKIKGSGLTNIIIFCVRAEQLLSHLPCSSIDKYHIYFPDPWPKTNHRRRRFFRMPNLDLLNHSLIQGGNIYFATDFFDYYFQAKILCLLHSGFRLSNDKIPLEVYTSVYSKKIFNAKKKIYMLSVIKS